MVGRRREQAKQKGQSCDNDSKVAIITPGFQQIEWVNTDTDEFRSRRLQHRDEAENFYRELAMRGLSS